MGFMPSMVPFVTLILVRSPRSTFSECLLAGQRSQLLNMKQKRKSDTWNRLRWRTYWTFTKYLFWLIITENSINMATSSVENIIFPMKKLRYIAINPSCHFISPFVRLWGKKKKRPQHCDNHDLRKTYGLAASSYPSQLLDTLTAHLSQQVLYTQSHNSKATKIDYNCAKESIMPRIKEWHLRKMPTSFHSLCSLYCMNKGLLAGPITWMARPKWSQSCFCLWRVKTMPCDLKPWHQKRKMIYHDLPVISLLKQCFFSICEVTV